MIPGYLKNHYARRIYNREYPQDSCFHGFLGETAVRELLSAGNVVDPKPWGAVLNPSRPSLLARRPLPDGRRITIRIVMEGCP